MLRFLTKRVFLEAIPTLFVIVTLSFFLVRLAPGGPFSSEKELPAQTRAALDAYYGFDQPLLTQFQGYLGRLLKGDLGPALKKPGRTVNELIANTLPVSVELGLWALLYAAVLGLMFGVLAAIRPNSWSDHVPMSLAMVGICMPSFVMGPLLVLGFSLHLGWFPVAGWETPLHRVLPVITLGSGYAAYIARLARGGMLEELSRDYIRTARAKGLSEANVILRHALRGGVLPVASFLGPAAAGLLTGTFVVESIFQIPGLGDVIVNAAFNRDYFVVMGCTLLFGAMMVAFNTLVDIALAVLNPRIRLPGA